MYYTMENFINYCDRMQIAEEGLFSKKTITVDKAHDVKTESEMKSRMYGEDPLIHLAGNDANILKNIFKKMKKKGMTGSIVSGINAANGYTNLAYQQGKNVEDSGQEDAMNYKLVEKNGESYLVFRKYKLV